MAYYISFLKTLSFRLNKHTIHFFYNEHTNDFPLYTEAIKFFNHGESMVRIAVRTLSLNVYRLPPFNGIALIAFFNATIALIAFFNATIALIAFFFNATIVQGGRRGHA